MELILRSSFSFDILLFSLHRRGFVPQILSVNHRRQYYLSTKQLFININNHYFYQNIFLKSYVSSTESTFYSKSKLKPLNETSPLPQAIPLVETPSDKNVSGERIILSPVLLQSKKVGVIARFKQMYKQYWYVLVPVHVITSTGWMVCFYYLSKSGVDITSMLQSLSISESIINQFKDSTIGHVAIAYLCYKVVTPIRYMVTIGGTTISIKYLEQWRYIKPIPSTADFRKMYDDKKAQIQRSYDVHNKKETTSNGNK